MIAEIVPARPAATVMVMRDAAGGAGVEVFMVRRHGGAAFAAGMYVFPGGRVDDVDRSDQMAGFVHGPDDAAASALLGIDRGGLSYFVAAIRECFEESGLLLARSRDGSVPTTVDADRGAVHRGELSIADLCRRHDVVLDAAALRYVAHWVTPVGESRRRFDTRFFLAAAPDGQEGRHDDAETVASRWVRPEEILDSVFRGELTLMPPTMASLQIIAGSANVGEALDRGDGAGSPPRIQPKIRRNAVGEFAGLSMPGDADYDDLV